MTYRSKPAPPRRRFVLCAAVLAVVMAQASLAAPPARDPNRERALRQLADEAKAAFQSGDALRAADLYWQGWLLDPTDGGYLYGSARALHAAGALDAAVSRFRAFLELAHQDPRLAARARESLQRAEAERAHARAAAVAAPPADALAGAVTPGDAEAEAAAVATAAAQTPTAVPPQLAPSVLSDPATLLPPLAAPPPPPARDRGPFFLTLAGGTTLLAGAIVAGVAARQRVAFQAAVAPGGQGGHIAAYPSRVAAESAADAIATRQEWGAALIGTGLAMAVSGALWWWLRDGPADVRAVPQASGAP